MAYLTAAQALDDDQILIGPACLMEAEMAGKWCQARGWNERPLWIDIAAGLRPPDLAVCGSDLGEWRHGWQFHASDAIAKASWNILMHELAAPSFRQNAATTGKSRVRSCMGPYSATWLTVCPTTDALTIKSSVLQFAIRRRLGIAACWDGPDPHGHTRVAARGANMNARHRDMNAAWRQVLSEAGGLLPQRNVERILRSTHVPVPPDDCRRLDLIVPGLNVERGLPLFCDTTVLSPIAGNGTPRPGTSNRDGRILEDAQNDNDDIYSEVITSGLGALLCLGCEVYGRWSSQCVKLVPALAREYARGLHPRVRRGTSLALQHRWWGILGVALQNSVAHMVIHADAGADLACGQLEPTPCLADLEILA